MTRPDPTRPYPIKSGKIVTRLDPIRPDPTRPPGPSDPLTTLIDSSKVSFTHTLRFLPMVDAASCN